MIFQTKRHDFDTLYQSYIQELGFSFSSSLNEVCESFYRTPIYPCDGIQIFLSALRINRSYLKSIILNQLIGEVLLAETQQGLLLADSPITKFEADSDEQVWLDYIQAHLYAALTLQSDTGSVTISELRNNEPFDTIFYWVDLDFTLHLDTYYGTQNSTYQYPFVIFTKLSAIKPYFNLSNYTSENAPRHIPANLKAAVEKIESDIHSKNVWKEQIAKHPELIDFYYPFDGKWRHYPSYHPDYWPAEYFILNIIEELELSGHYKEGWEYSIWSIANNPELSFQVNAVHIPSSRMQFFFDEGMSNMIESPQIRRTIYEAFQEGERVASDPSYHTTATHLFFHQGIDSLPSLAGRTPNVTNIFVSGSQINIIDLPSNLTHLYAQTIHIDKQAQKTLKVINDAKNIQSFEGTVLFKESHSDIELLRADLLHLQTIQETKHTKKLIYLLKEDTKSIRQANGLGESLFENWPFILRTLFKTDIFSSEEKKEIENALYCLSKQYVALEPHWSPHSMPEMEVLSLDACSQVEQITLTDQPLLKNLSLYSLRNLVEIQGLETCTALKTFHFEDSNYEYQYGTWRWDHYKKEGLCEHLNWTKLFQQLETLPNLKKLHMVGGKPPKISRFHTPRKIETLYFDNFVFDDIILPTSLKNLTMISKSIDLTMLERATNLERCELKGDDFSLPPTLPKSLKILSLMGKSITNLHMLHDLPNLQELHIVMEEFDASAIAQLKGLSLKLLGLMIGTINAPTVHFVQLNAHIDTSLDKLLDVYPSNSDV